MLYALCRRLFALLVAYPVIFLWMGLTVRRRDLFPQRGPAVVVANHNSHLDTLALISFFSLRRLPEVRIAAAADYFFRNRVACFFATWFLGLLPLSRQGRAEHDPLAPMVACLDAGGIVIIFPEGTRGQAEQMGEFKPGLWHLLRRCPGASLHPVYLHGLGRSLPKGEWIPVPLFIDACVGESLPFCDNKREFMQRLKDLFLELRSRTLAGLEQEREGNTEDIL